jgi:transcriptional regulator of arginine metabolism
MPTTAARRRALRSLLEERAPTSQAELVSLLAGRGFRVTQATVSRDLRALGAGKGRDGRYRLGGGNPDEALDALGRVIDEFVSFVGSSGNLVVLKTPPGAAQVVAAAIDAAGLNGVLGTVAGDDTVLVVASEQVTGRGLAHKLEEIGAKR